MERRISWGALLALTVSLAALLATAWMAKLLGMHEGWKNVAVAALPVLLSGGCAWTAWRGWGTRRLRAMAIALSLLLCAAGALGTTASALAEPDASFSQLRYRLARSMLSQEDAKRFPEALTGEHPSMCLRFPLLQGGFVFGARCFMDMDEYERRMDEARASAIYAADGEGEREGGRYYVPTASWFSEDATFDGMEVLILKNEETGSPGVRWNHGRALVVAGREETGEMIWLAEDW
ncbi:MAG: hypothetical protein Q4E13_07035 [Clostridia bacterium]|nr:hypothetical protein [Clostridia bacterium]